MRRFGVESVLKVTGNKVLLQLSHEMFQRIVEVGIVSPSLTTSPQDIEASFGELRKQSRHSHLPYMSHFPATERERRKQET
jgi:hypothetical protein